MDKNGVIKQLSVFLENKTGRLNHVAEILGAEGINMTAFSVADNSDFGILRVIVSDPQKALTVLKENRFAVSLTDVICLRTSNEPGTLSKVLKILEQEQIYIEYMYAFLNPTNEAASVIFRIEDNQKAIKVLQDNGIRLLANEEVNKL